MCQAKEIHNRAIAGGIGETVPDLWAVTHALSELSGPIPVIAESPYKGET